MRSRAPGAKFIGVGLMFRVVIDDQDCLDYFAAMGVA
jgi:hypothetical protein